MSSKSSRIFSTRPADFTTVRGMGGCAPSTGVLPRISAGCDMPTFLPWGRTAPCPRSKQGARNVARMTRRSLRHVHGPRREGGADLGLREAQLAQDLLSVLAEAG